MILDSSRVTRGLFVTSISIRATLRTEVLGSPDAGGVTLAPLPAGAGHPAPILERKESMQRYRVQTLHLVLWPNGIS